MLFWNRIEVYCGYSMKDFSELRDILVSNGLKYYDRLVIRKHHGTNSNHSGIATLGQDRKTQYYLYVHKKDYDNAMFLMHHEKKL